MDVEAMDGVKAEEERRNSLLGSSVNQSQSSGDDGSVGERRASTAMTGAYLPTLAASTLGYLDGALAQDAHSNPLKTENAPILPRPSFSEDGPSTTLPPITALGLRDPQSNNSALHHLATFAVNQQSSSGFSGGVAAPPNNPAAQPQGGSSYNQRQTVTIHPLNRNTQLPHPQPSPNYYNNIQPPPPSSHTFTSPPMSSAHPRDPSASPYSPPSLISPHSQTREYPPLQSPTSHYYPRNDRRGSTASFYDNPAQGPPTGESYTSSDDTIVGTPMYGQAQHQRSLSNENLNGGFKCTYEGCTAPPFQTQYLLK